METSQDSTRYRSNPDHKGLVDEERPDSRNIRGSWDSQKKLRQALERWAHSQSFFLRLNSLIFGHEGQSRFCEDSIKTSTRRNAETKETQECIQEFVRRSKYDLGRRLSDMETSQDSIRNKKSRVLNPVK